jgi:hypothetical protein
MIAKGTNQGRTRKNNLFDGVVAGIEKNLTSADVNKVLPQKKDKKPRPGIFW